jgi:uncharacterized membrane protein YjfL (UPF0719 family)
MLSPFLPLVVVLFALLLFAWLVRLLEQFVWKVGVKDLLSGTDRDAAGIEYAGFFFGVLTIVASVMGRISLFDPASLHSPETGVQSFLDVAAPIAVHGVLGILLLAALGRLGLNLIIGRNILPAIHANNVAAGILSLGGHVSLGLVIAGVLSGNSSGGDSTTTIVFLIIGTATLYVVTWLFRFITSYDDAKEIANGNIAAAIGYAGMMVAVALVVGRALEGDFTTYEASFTLYGKSLLVVLLLYPVRQFIVQGIFLSGGFHFYGGRLDEQISRKHSIGAGAMEAAAYLVAAILGLRLGL